MCTIGFSATFTQAKFDLLLVLSQQQLLLGGGLQQQLSGAMRGRAFGKSEASASEEHSDILHSSIPSIGSEIVKRTDRYSLKADFYQRLPIIQMRKPAKST